LIWCPFVIGSFYWFMWKNVEMWNHHIQDPIAISPQGFLTYLKIFIQINHNVTLVSPPSAPPPRCQLVLWWYLVCRVKFRLKLAPFCWNWDKNPTMELVFCWILNWNQNHKKMFLSTRSRFLSREVEFFWKFYK
jgi:hypothetical protein